MTDNALRAVYILSIRALQIVLLCGGSTLTYLSGSLWWVAGGIIFAVLYSNSLAFRMNNWRSMGGRGK